MSRSDSSSKMNKPITGAWVFVRRAVVSISWALAVVLIGSRINPPIQGGILDRQPRLIDELIPAVDIDCSSLQSAVESLRKVAKTKVDVDMKSLEVYSETDPNYAKQKPLRLRNVRLGAALSAVMTLKQFAGSPEFHEEGGAIVIGGRGTSRLPIYTQIYDLRDLLDMHVASGSAPWRDNTDPISASYESLFIESLGWEKWGDWQSPWSLAVWSGRLIVKANREGHHSVQELLRSLGAKAPAPGPGVATRTRPDPTAQKLEKIIQSVEVKKGRLDRLLAFLADSTGVNMAVNWRTLKAAGISHDCPLTLNLQKLPARVMLNEALRQAGGGNVSIRYRITEGIMYISTDDELINRELITRVYDINDLIQETLDQWNRDGTTGSEQDAFDQLVRMLQETIMPTSWGREDGRGRWGMGMYKGKLIVTQPAELHAELIELLSGLRTEARH